MPREWKNEQGFTGLEAAIIFIAFVVVASVFAYVVLGAGMTTSQKSQEVLHAALDEARSTFRPGNAVIAKLDTAGGLSSIEFDLETAAGPTALDEARSTFRPGNAVIAKLDTAGGLSSIEFDLETAAGPTAIDMRSMTCTLATSKALLTYPPGDPAVTLTWRYRKDTNDILEEGEVVTVKLNADSKGIKRGDTFTVGVATAGGATASLTRTIPAGTRGNTYIELF